MQPVSNQYNITDKIKEANHELYKGEQFQRSSQPKVRFRDHQLVDFEPDDGSIEVMERRTSISINSTSTITINNNVSSASSSVNVIAKIKEESSDDGYIDEEDEAIPDRVIVESIEIEEVCEQIEVLDAMTVDSIENDNENDEEIYSKDDFHDDEDERAIVTAIKAKPERKQKRQPQQVKLPSQHHHQQQEKAKKHGYVNKNNSASKKVFRSKINPSVDESMAVMQTPSMEIIDQDIMKKTRSGHKQCCQHKNEYKLKLPKYNGFTSNYGLSKEELDRRRFNQLRNSEFQQNLEVKKSEQKDYVAKANEEAFSKW